MSAPIGVFERLCPHCGTVAPDGLTTHVECAIAVTRERVNERIAQDIAKEKREERAKLDAAALVARRQERERIVGVLRELARTTRAEAADDYQQATQQAIAQRAAALDDAAAMIEREGL